MLPCVGNDQHVIGLDGQLAQRSLTLDLGDVYSEMRLQPDAIPVHDADQRDWNMKHGARAPGDFIEGWGRHRFAELQSSQLGQTLAFFSRCPGTLHNIGVQRTCLIGHILHPVRIQGQVMWPRLKNGKFPKTIPTL